MIRRIVNIWHPAIYQGTNRMRAHFEGWYFKLVDRQGKNIYAVIPGVSFDKQGDAHCFIQLLNGKDASSKYFRYDISSFRYSDKTFQLWVGQSYFSSDKVEINISDAETSISGTLIFDGIIPWPSTACSPGAMGWYAFMPFMECYHAVVSFNHDIKGGLKIDGCYIDFNGGLGYIEKDWGRSFPYYYVWSQSNHFGQPGTSIMVSIANIPWLGGAFDGFMVGFLCGEHLYRFTTYNGASIDELKVDTQSLTAGFTSRGYYLQVEAHKSSATDLAAPNEGAMEGRIAESMTSEIHVKLCRLERGHERLIFEGSGRNAGLEITGEIARFKQVTRSRQCDA
ncbi:MAG: tocopherol cyclase family protein [Dehalococcoidia bacterium]